MPAAGKARHDRRIVISRHQLGASRFVPVVFGRLVLGRQACVAEPSHRPKTAIGRAVVRMRPSASPEEPLLGGREFLVRQ